MNEGATAPHRHQPRHDSIRGPMIRSAKTVDEMPPMLRVKAVAVPNRLELLFAFAFCRSIRRVANLYDVGEVCVGYAAEGYWAQTDALLADGLLIAPHGYYELSEMGTEVLAPFRAELKQALAEHTDQEALPL